MPNLIISETNKKGRVMISRELIGWNTVIPWFRVLPGVRSKDGAAINPMLTDSIGRKVVSCVEIPLVRHDINPEIEDQ